MVGRSGATIAWPEGASDCYIYGADIGFDCREDGQVYTIFNPED